ncbi:hypothetical protein, partial [Chryseobacterium sp.]|uniref:hypothetical protein n=1 Tax=Chryseobacterium sp. TaxID=1871047 RepID=UPI002FC89096
MEEREKITKKIDKIRISENILKLETASKYIGRCFSNKKTENIKIVGCRVCGCVVFEVLSFSISHVDGDILWY